MTLRGAHNNPNHKSKTHSKKFPPPYYDLILALDNYIEAKTEYDKTRLEYTYAYDCTKHNKDKREKEFGAALNDYVDKRIKTVLRKVVGSVS